MFIFVSKHKHAYIQNATMLIQQQYIQFKYTNNKQGRAKTMDSLLTFPISILAYYYVRRNLEGTNSAILSILFFFNNILTFVTFMGVIRMGYIWRRQTKNKTSQSREPLIKCEAVIEKRIIKYYLTYKDMKNSTFYKLFFVPVILVSKIALIGVGIYYIRWSRDMDYDNYQYFLCLLFAYCLYSYHYMMYQLTKRKIRYLPFYFWLASLHVLFVCVPIIQAEFPYSIIRSEYKLFPSIICIICYCFEMQPTYGSDFLNCIIFIVLATKNVIFILYSVFVQIALQNNPNLCTLLGDSDPSQSGFFRYFILLFYFVYLLRCFNSFGYFIPFFMRNIFNFLNWKPLLRNNWTYLVSNIGFFTQYLQRYKSIEQQILRNMYDCAFCQLYLYFNPTYWLKMEQQYKQAANIQYIQLSCGHSYHQKCFTLLSSILKQQKCLCAHEAMDKIMLN